MSSEARFFINVVGFALVDGLLILSCALAWLKGGAAERWGATLYFGSAVISVAIAFVTHNSYAEAPMLVFEGLVAIGFLALAIRYNSLWLGAAMMLKGAQLALHASHLTEGTDARIGQVKFYPLALDAISISISLTLLYGVIAGVRARSRAQTRGATASPAAAA